MNNKYNHKDIEPKWQKIWEDENTFAAENNFNKPKYYALVEFPYPSGQGLHVGHPRSYTALDIIARKRRMQGYNVLYPMGWDAFGLPTENFAIKNKIHPKIVTKQNIEKFKKQLKSLGLSFDWNREINTTDPEYYKWTQWIFLQLFEKGLAYKSESTVNWCTSCKCVLANEEVIQGKCERCSNEVVRKIKAQWMLKITKYAQRLIDDLDLVNYPERVRAQQKHWIGRSEGAEISFETSAGANLKVFTTRPDTLFGVTYMAISPEHPLLSKWGTKIQNIKEIENYQTEANKKSDFERAELAKNKTGVKIEGVTAIHPVTGKNIPIFVSDYVMMSYGTGAIMAVPAHDERDLEFAQKYDLPITEVVQNGKIINSDFISGLTCEDAKKEIIKWLEINNKGASKINYKLRDWIFSRQRYWGEPIPIICCDKCGFVPISEEELPLELPDVQSFETADDGESPLSKITDWVNTICPKCGQTAKRETDTMPQWAGSSWYFLRYLDPKNNTALASKEAIDYWMPIDWYNGGMEHTTLHLLYSRFWHKFLYDIGVVPTPEPYAKRTSHGMILGENGEKMSKSKGNVINPDEIVEKYGADTLRLYEMFIGDFEKAAPWSDSSIRGCRRFLERYWGLQEILDNSKSTDPKMDAAINKTVKKVGEDTENLKFNTAIAALMALLNEFYEIGSINNDELKIFTILLNLFAPHITEEVWKNHTLGEGLVAKQIWPKYNAAKCIDKEIEIAVQVNGKVKSKLIITPDMTKDKVFALAKKDEILSKIIDGKEIKKLIYVPQKLLNIVI